MQMNDDILKELENATIKLEKIKNSEEENINDDKIDLNEKIKLLEESIEKEIESNSELNIPVTDQDITEPENNIKDEQFLQFLLVSVNLKGFLNRNKVKTHQ